MITRDTMRESISRIRLMRMFPGGGDADILAALARELNECCSDDTAVVEVVNEFVRVNENWPGIHELHRTAESQKQRRASAEQLSQAKAARDAHESSCPGYKVEADETDRVVRVITCRATFDGGRDIYGSRELLCRVGNNEERAEEIMREELSKRGSEWTSYKTFLDRQFAKRYASIKLTR
jgi:hypothetical protein